MTNFIPLYCAAQVREMDRIAIQEFGTPGILLMNRAGEAVFNEIINRWPEHRALTVFCGIGNNGGDGFVVGRLGLKNGFTVTLYSLVDRAQLKGDAAIACDDFCAAGGRFIAFTGQTIADSQIIVDAVFGIGLDREVSGSFALAIKRINNAQCPVISVDIPSGLHADSGKILGQAVNADCTVSFIALKQGLFTGSGRGQCGDVVLADLDINQGIVARLTPSACLLTDPKLPFRHRCEHKGNNGHVLLIGGDAGYSGAIRLAAEAALRSGAGLVSVATREKHAEFIHAGRPEIMSHGVEHVNQLQHLLNKATVVVIGPGLGQSEWAKSLLSAVIHSGKTSVFDADALNLLAKQPVLQDNRVLTPHPGEAARLLACTTAEINAQRFDAVRQLQEQYGGVVLLKGAGTLIQDAENTYVTSSGNPGMASGGMGDVLAGMIGALIAQGWSISDSAAIAAQVHGTAADFVAAEGGERGMLASDLMLMIRKLLN